MSTDLEITLYIFMLATFLGLEVIRKVSPLLHTPLMSLTNAISAISVVGAIMITGAAGRHHAEQGARVHRHHRRGDQHRQRVPHHRPHAQDVQEAGREEVMAAHGQLRLHPLGRAVHPLAEVDELAGHRAAQRPGGRNRHADGHRRHAARLQSLQLGVDSGGVLHRDRGRHSHRLYHAHDRRAAADRDVPRLRRAGRRAGGHGRVLQGQPVPRDSAHLRDGPAHARNAARASSPSPAA